MNVEAVNSVTRSYAADSKQFAVSVNCLNNGAGTGDVNGMMFPARLRSCENASQRARAVAEPLHRRAERVQHRHVQIRSRRVFRIHQVLA